MAIAEQTAQDAYNNTRLSILTGFQGLLSSVRDTQRSCRIGW